jgi:hypothetical protein
MLVILGTQEAEIKKIKFKASLGNSSETLSRKKPSQKKGWLSSSRYKPWIQVPVLPKKKKKTERKKIKDILFSGKSPKNLDKTKQ